MQPKNLKNMTTTNNPTKKRATILGFPFFVIMILLVVSILHIILAYDKTTNNFNNTWHNLMSMLFFIMIISALLKFIGSKTPVLKDIGGGPILCLMIPAFLLNYKFLADDSLFTKFQAVFKQKATFLSSTGNIGFIEFFVCSLIAASLLGIEKKLLKRAFKKFLPLVIISLAISATVVGIMGAIFKPIGGVNGIEGSSYNSFINAIFYIFVPISCGGLTCGIIPLTMIFSQGNSVLEEQFKSHILPALLISGIFSIVMAGLIKKIWSKSKYDSPNGKIEKEILSNDKNKHNKKDAKTTHNEINYEKMTTGLVLIFALYVFSNVFRSFILKIFPQQLSKYMPPTIIFLVILVLLLKIWDVMNSYYIHCIEQASKSITTNFTSSIFILIGCGIDINKLIISFANVSFLLTCISCVIVTALASAIIGNKMGYYPLQSAIAAGLCSNSIGGAGNTAILEASNSFELMPYAQISTRLGGDIIVIIASILFPLFFHIN